MCVWVFVYVCVCAKLPQSCPTLCNPWTVSHQAPLSMGFYRQKHWSGLPCPSPGDLPNPRIVPGSLTSPALQTGSLGPHKLIERRKWQPTPVLMPGKSHGQRSLAGYRSQSMGLHRVGHDWATFTFTLIVLEKGDLPLFKRYRHYWKSYHGKKIKKKDVYLKINMCWNKTFESKLFL